MKRGKDSMPAGPELDHLVAEMVMGWKPAGDGQAWAGDWGTGHARAFRPSIDIAHAWEVVESLRGRLVLLGVLPHGEGDKAWVCGWEDYRPKSRGRAPILWYEAITYSDEGGPWAFGDTAPLAICRAALAALS